MTEFDDRYRIFGDHPNFEELKRQIIDALTPDGGWPPMKFGNKANGTVIDVEYEEVDDGN